MRRVASTGMCFGLVGLAMAFFGPAVAGSIRAEPTPPECVERDDLPQEPAPAGSCARVRRVPQRIAALHHRDRSHRTDPFGRFTDPGLHRGAQGPSVARLAELTRLALDGRRPRFLRWSTESRAPVAGARTTEPVGLERFSWMTAPLSPDVRLFPAYTPDAARWAGVLESTLSATTDCVCPGGDPGGGGTTASAGRIPDGIVTIGTLLTVGKNAASPGDLDLAWGASCAVTASDYAVYEGTLGSYYSHTRNTCTTGGQTDVTITPSPGDRYFLTVALSPDAEGEYGADSTGTGRPVGTNVCRSARRTSCP